MHRLLFIVFLLPALARSQGGINEQTVGRSLDSVFQYIANAPGLAVGIVSKNKLVINKKYG